MRLFEDPVARLLVRRLAGDQLVEGRLGVEHHRPQLALHLDPVLLEQLGVDPARLVAQLAQAERVGEPLRRVDRQHADAQPAGRHAGRDRRRGRRLADPAGAGADADVLAFEDLADRRPSGRASSRAVCAASTPSSGSKRKGRVLTGASTRRRRRASWARCERARPCSESAARAAARAAPFSPAAARRARSASSLEKRSG